MLLCTVGLGLLLGLGGCGTAASTESAAGANQRVTKIIRRGRERLVVVGTVTETQTPSVVTSATTTTPPSTGSQIPVAAFAGPGGTERFDRFVDTICAAVRGLSPARPIGASPGQLAIYQSALAKSARRTTVSLGRIRAPGSEKTKLARVIAAEQGLVSLYSEPTSGSVAKHLHALETAQAGESAIAAGAGFYDCTATAGSS